MADEQNFKRNDLDNLIGDNHLQMMKAALPYMNVTEQRLISLLVKTRELRKTIRLFQDGEVAAMGICSMEKRSTSPVDMLNAIKPYGNTYEQEFIDMMANFIQGSRLYRSYQETMPESEKAKGAAQMPPRFSLEQLKNFLPPEQQSRMETIQLVMQAMQQMA